MRILTIGAALLATTVAAQAQSVDPQQQAILERRVELQHCQVARDADLGAGVPSQRVAQMYQNCRQMAEQKYDRALRAAGLQGNTAACTRPDGCAAPKGGFHPDPNPKKQPVPSTCPTGAGCK
jgi:hypothetical protein